MTFALFSWMMFARRATGVARVRDLNGRMRVSMLFCWLWRGSKSEPSSPTLSCSVRIEQEGKVTLLEEVISSL